MPKIHNREHDARIEAYLTGNEPFEEALPLTRAIAVRDIYGRDIARSSWKQTMERIQKKSGNNYVIDIQLCPVSLRRSKCIYLEGVNASKKLGKALFSWDESRERAMRHMLTFVTGTSVNEAHTGCQLAELAGIEDFPKADDTAGLREFSRLLHSSKEGFGIANLRGFKFEMAGYLNGDSLIWRDA